MELIMSSYASNFYEIPNALLNNSKLREHVVALMKKNNIIAKSLEGGKRLEKFRNILVSLAEGELTIEEAIKNVTSQLPAQNSDFSGNNRVFPNRWEERLIRVQFSRFYNQAVLESEKEKGKNECYIPISDVEDPNSLCSQQLANTQQNINLLLDRLKASYEEGDFKNKNPKIPDHPNCTHVVKPLN